MKQLLLLLFVVILVRCRDSTKDLFYTVSEGNLLVIQAYSLKDSVCGTSHTVTNIIPGKARKTELDMCVEAIKIKDCDSWKISDPTPQQCKGIAFRL